MIRTLKFEPLSANSRLGPGVRASGAGVDAFAPDSRVKLQMNSARHYHRASASEDSLRKLKPELLFGLH